MFKNVLLGAIGGAVLNGALGFALGLITMSDQHEAGAYAFAGGALAAPFGLGLGALAGFLTDGKRSPVRIGAVCGSLGLAVGLVLMVGLVSMVTDNFVMGLLAMIVFTLGAFFVGFGVATWRR